jgi:hypothetical protein
MIEVSPEAACVIYLIGAFFLMFGFWIYHYRKNSKNEVVSFPTKRFTCEFCLASYLEDPVKSITRCPECHSLNKNLRKRKS